jgi:hypothetical protein
MVDRKMTDSGVIEVAEQSWNVYKPVVR